MQSRRRVVRPSGGGVCACAGNHAWCSAFFALPYNPYGVEKIDYAWTFPKRWFDMVNDPCVLIGNEFWDFIGGVGTYAQFIDAVNAMGKNYHERIYREYLGIEPPHTPEDYLLR